MIEKGTVEYDRNDVIERQTAYILKCAFSDALGIELGFDSEGDGDGAIIRLCHDGRIKKGSWRISVSGNTVLCSASTYYGYLGIAKYIRGEAAKPILTLSEGSCAEGSFFDTLDEVEESARYAYDKKGEIRLMFYNVLFNDPAPDLRNILSAEVVRQYAPDILGCQEFNRTKRDGAGERDLAKLLSDIGYVEAVDPWVRNALPIEEGGYGTERIGIVTVGGETYHSNSNCTPLFYNKKTTKCLDSEYYWFKHQLDWENEGRCSCRDCASKSMTWGVFENIETGKRYIVASVHMCTISNGVKREQAIEAVDIFSRLREKYNCPIFIGGDYNALWTHANYEHFTSKEVGYVDIGRNGIAELHSSESRTYHRPYPVYHEELDMVLPDEADDTAIDLAGGVDHILLDKIDDVSVKVYGVVIDEIAAAGSDHYPIFADVDVK